MDVLTTSPSPPDAVAAERALEGYDETTVDDFLRAVAEEQERLGAEIAEATAREARATALVGMHESMLATMRDAYREVTATRRSAESEAAATVEAARRRAADLRLERVR